MFVKYLTKLSTKFNSFLKLNNKIRNLSNTRNVSSAVNFHSFLAETWGVHIEGIHIYI